MGKPKPESVRRGVIGRSKKRKNCRLCGSIRKIKFFHRHRREKDGRYDICKFCRSKTKKHEWSPEVLKRRLPYFRRYRAKKRRILNEIKEKRGCRDCREKDPCCLQFHHRNPEKKYKTISRLYAGTWGLDRLMAEIAKCDILCANCHLKFYRREDARRRIG